MPPTRRSSDHDGDERPDPAQRELDVVTRQRELQARIELDDMTVTLKSPQARRVLWRVLEQCAVFQDVFAPDALQLAHRSGRQSVGRFLWAAIDDVDDSAVNAMRLEARARAKRNALELEAIRTPPTTEE